ncbi:MAG: IgGFc-binding protein [Polyangiaceae bacterium]
MLTCANVTSQPSNLGCEFWAVDLDQQDYAGSDPASASWGVVLTNPGTVDANVTIEENTAAVGQTVTPSTVVQVTVAKGGVQTVKLPIRELDCGSKPNDSASPGTCLSSRAFRISATAPIAAHQFNTIDVSASSDASLLLPSHALGKTHRVVGFNAGHPKPATFPGIGLIVDRSFVTVVGVKPNTQVKVTPTWRIKGNAPISATAAGGSISVVLGPFDVLNLETDDATDADMTATVADLSGTAVESDQPVAVFTGVESAGVPGALSVPTPPGWSSGDTCCLDHLEEQVIPAESLGTSYVVTRSPVRSTGGFQEADVLRFVGGSVAATVKTSLPAPFDSFTLNPGEVKTTHTQADVTVSSTQPVTVGQLLVSQQLTSGGTVGDPSLLIFPPVAHWLTDYLIPTPAGWAQSWIVIAAPVGANVTLDGAAPAGCTTQSAGALSGTSYESKRCNVSAGSHRLQSATPFGVAVYGYGSSVSYAMPGGSAL